MGFIDYNGRPWVSRNPAAPAQEASISFVTYEAGIVEITGRGVTLPVTAPLWVKEILAQLVELPTDDIAQFRPELVAESERLDAWVWAELEKP